MPSLHRYGVRYGAVGPSQPQENMIYKDWFLEHGLSPLQFTQLYAVWLCCSEEDERDVAAVRCHYLRYHRCADPPLPRVPNVVLESWLHRARELGWVDYVLQKIPRRRKTKRVWTRKPLKEALPQ